MIIAPIYCSEAFKTYFLLLFLFVCVFVCLFCFVLFYYITFSELVKIIYDNSVTKVCKLN